MLYDFVCYVYLAGNWLCVCIYIQLARLALFLHQKFFSSDVSFVCLTKSLQVWIEMRTHTHTHTSRCMLEGVT